MNKIEIRDLVRHHKVTTGANPFSYSKADIRYISDIIVKEIIVFTSKNKITPFDIPWDKNKKIKNFQLKNKIRKNRIDTFNEETIRKINSLHGISLKHNKTQAHFVSYSRKNREDYISMPHPEAFTHKKYYYKTLFHEFAHALSNRNRLALGYGRGIYTSHREELVAETVALVSCFILGLNCWENCLGYIEEWNGYNPATSILSEKKNLDIYKYNVNKISEFIFCIKC